MNDFTDVDAEDNAGDEEGPSYPLTPHDLVGWVVLGSAHAIGAVANTLGNIANELFAAGRHKRELDDFKNMISDTRDDLEKLVTGESKS